MVQVSAGGPPNKSKSQKVGQQTGSRAPFLHGPVHAGKPALECFCWTRFLSHAAQTRLSWVHKNTHTSAVTKGGDATTGRCPPPKPHPLQRHTESHKKPVIRTEDLQPGSVPPQPPPQSETVPTRTNGTFRKQNSTDSPILVHKVLHRPTSWLSV